MSEPFQPMNNATQRIQLDSADLEVSPWPEGASVAWIDNRGETDVLVAFGEPCSDTTSYTVPAGMSQPITVYDGLPLHLKRPAGASAELVLVTPGWGV